jgi:Sporulation and spore germination
MIPRQLVIVSALLLALAISMGLYITQLRRHEALKAPAAVEVEHVTPPSSGPAQSFTVWVAHDDTCTLRPQSITVPFSSTRQQRAEDLLRGLLEIYTAKDSPHRLGAAAEIRDVYLVPPGLAVIDVNAAFADQQTSGIMAEELTVASMTQTLASNFPELTRVKFLVEGKEQETLAGHADLSGIYDVAAASQLAKQLAAQ